MSELTASEFAKLSDEEKRKRCKELSPLEYSKYRIGYEIPTFHYVKNDDVNKNTK